MLDITKPVMQRNGNKARIIATDVNSTYPIVAILTDNVGAEYVDCFKLNGEPKFWLPEHDLINVPEKITKWVALYSLEKGIYTTSADDREELAQRMKSDCRAKLLSIKKIEFTIGEFEE